VKALQFNYPKWSVDDSDDAPDRELRLVWEGHMRVVRNRKRARRLKRRGVPLLHIGIGDGTPAQQQRKPSGALEAFGPWAWFETFENREARMQARHERAQARFIKRNPLPPTEFYCVHTTWVAADPWNRMEVAFTPGAAS
jgi:hypothetical protein